MRRTDLSEVKVTRRKTPRALAAILSVGLHAAPLLMLLQRRSAQPDHSASVEAPVIHLQLVAPSPSQLPPQPTRQAEPRTQPIVRSKPRRTPPMDLPPTAAPIVSPVSAPQPPAEPPQAAPQSTLSPPTPPAVRAASATPTWEGLVLGALEQHKRFPSGARRRQGVSWVRFVIDRQGRVLSSRLERSSGVPALDAEAIALPRRAQPLPKPPPDVPGERIELVAPVEFFLR